jgi:hypothetical protein
MKTIMISHLRCSPSTKSILGGTLKTDYFTAKGIVREFNKPGRVPKYKLLGRFGSKKVNVEFV